MHINKLWVSLLPVWGSSLRVLRRSLVSFFSSPCRPTVQMISEEGDTSTQLWTDRKPRESSVYWMLFGVRDSFWFNHLSWGLGYQPSDPQLTFTTLLSVHTADRCRGPPVSRVKGIKNINITVKCHHHMLYSCNFMACCDLRQSCKPL